MSVWVGSGRAGGGLAPPVTTAPLSTNTSMESGIEAGVLPTVTGSLASARDSLGSLSRAAEPLYDTDHTDLGSELDEAEIRRELMHDFDPEGFGEIPWPDFLLTLQNPDFKAQVPPHKLEILLDKAQSATSDSITFQEFVNVSKSSSQPINIFKDADEPNLSTFYSQAIFDDPLLCCSQDDMNAYMKYQNECLNRDQDNSPPKASKRSKETSKKTGTSKNKSPNNELNSYIIKKIKKGKRVIKISISNLELDNEYKEIAVQYVVEDDYNEMLNATEDLVNKIVKKLSNVSY